MTNKSIAKSIENELQEFEAGRRTASSVESAVEKSIQAMEGISQRDIEDTRELTYQLVIAALEDESPSTALDAKTQTALGALRDKISRLGDL